MAQETIPKYDYFIVYVDGNANDLRWAFNTFNTEIEGMVNEGWQASGEQQITPTGYYGGIVLSIQMKRYSKSYERYKGYSDARYVVTE